MEYHAINYSRTHVALRNVSTRRNKIVNETLVIINSQNPWDKVYTYSVYSLYIYFVYSLCILTCTIIALII